MATLAGNPLVRPFRALRPAPEYASEVAAPPYDVVTTEEARALAAGRKWSFLHISKAEIDLPPGTDPRAPEVYAKAAENMRAMVAAGVLVRDRAPGFYVYRVRAGDHVQTGIVGAGSVEAYDLNRIRKHELTQPAKEDDRVRQIEAVGAETGPVFVTHASDAALAAVIEAVVAAPPAYSVVLGSVEHTLWVVAGNADIKRIGGAFDAMEAIYIADGHHRSAAGQRATAAKRAANPGHTGAEDYNYFLIVSFPEDEVRILDYNRVIKDLNGLSEEEFLARVAAEFDVDERGAPVRPDRAGTYGMYLGGRWYGLAFHNAAPSGLSPVERLDISRLNRTLIEPVLAINDARGDPRIDFVGGVRGVGELAARVDSGDWAVAFSYFPTALRDLMAVADAGLVMPTKSTWFEPKLADGLVSLVLD